ncbi:calcium/calmodulin-dependent protein kinase kinase 1 isoform X1 [Drosophila pseudoobscura]|uniref:calcium/calmodulin-dependent protein kinase n=1 Tax=Drosophila pseudoobscura pseudoobscura TaxID=46245 RepID=A0A6I8W620_DROPS|nr:calcium/calmodulin-dependent protein kinase kinase 1 isoform X1 [Drosophila pseudoobscura]XP_015038087.2 calcium/calmodulin-dependent protein kinase kinase 1 isoform X1 [Drosophila pseudoobscura]XP_015038088.2 calcium/calmodulin-dependent protein kinase kinase 1 isoform X1 [Drosophila pseudoobscura]XP_033238805.1 calcium/calmodulin-dependent protein kinase kinase 1 isoform X1 [Drosophila pseudoobscura]
MDAAQQSTITAGNLRSPEKEHVTAFAGTTGNENGREVQTFSEDDDDYVIVDKAQNGCEYTRLEKMGKQHTPHKTLQQISIESKQSNGRHSMSETICPDPSGAKPKTRNIVDDKIIQTLPTENISATNSKRVQIGKFLEGSKRFHNVVQSKDCCDLRQSDIDGPQNKPESEYPQLKCVYSRPIFLKSQSLEIYNEPNSFQITQSRLLPNINENYSNDNQNQTAQASDSVSQLTKSIDHLLDLNGEELDKSTCEATCLAQRPHIPLNLQSMETRPIYPNVPYSPYGSPFGSPRSNRRRPPLRESRRISIERSGSFLQLNQYKLMDQIGQGSYGLVKLAYSEEDSTHYAMKILSKKRLLRQAGLMRRGPKKTTSPLDRVYREIAVLKKLDHPNVVKLVEVLDDPIEDSLYMVFEWVKQGEVLRIPTDNPLSEERVWSIFRETLLGLEYLHYQKIIHADIKPGNLLLTECGHIKIADLGVCNEFLGEDAIMSNGSTGGTPAFRAPETLILGQNVYCGRASDVWALGATLYSLIFGNVPFLADSIPLLYERIQQDPVVFPQKLTVSENLKRCILHMLEKNATQRITVPELKINDWVTTSGVYPLPTEEENCCLVQVDEEDINSVVRSIPKLDTLILIKTMLKKHSFGNPFIKGVSGKALQPGGSRLERFVRAGRSNSAPGSYQMSVDRFKQPSTESLLPSLTEHSTSKISEDT